MYNVIFDLKEVILLLGNNTIPDEYKKRIKKVQTNDSLALSFTEDEMLELIHKCQDCYVMYGLDINQEPTEEGILWDNLIIRLIEISNKE